MMADFWRGKKVLVTGAGGFIASHLVERLVQHGAQVRAFVRYNSRADPGLLSLIPAPLFSELELVAGDLRDAAAVELAMQDMEVVFHLGALIDIPYSYLHPVEVVESNVIGTLNVLMAGRVCGVERIVHTSTSEVYGTALRAPIDESHPLQGQSPYAASKISADKLAESFNRSFDLPIVTLRPFNTYGPRQSTRAVIPTIITQALTQAVVFLGNLDARRDLTFIADTVEGFLKVAEAPDVEGETFNLGSGVEISIGELATLIFELTGSQVEIVIDKERLRPEKSEVQRLLANNSLARERIGWEPHYTLRDGLQTTIAWIRENLDYYKPGTYQY